MSQNPRAAVNAGLLRGLATPLLLFAVILMCSSVCHAAENARGKNPAKPMTRGVAGLVGATFEPPRRMRGKGIPWEHEIQVALPPSYGKSDKSYPILWVVDGSFMFDLAVHTVNFSVAQDIPEMIVVGVGAPPEAANIDEAQRRRLYEFTSNQSLGFKDLAGELLDRHLAPPPEHLGGAPVFLAFLLETVRPALAKEYRMANDHTVFGDSGGGFFCSYVLLTQPQAFKRYICGSPNLFMGNLELFEIEQRYAATHNDLNATVFFGAGEAEVLQGRAISGWGIVSSMARMAEILRLRDYPSLKLQVRIFPGEDHRSAIPLSLAWGLRSVWTGQAGR